MSLPLPPRSVIRCDAATAQNVYDQLTSVLAGHPQATTTYRFYEEVDAWLGPWGQNGYPIGYGKFYNIAFTSNRKLMANPQTRDWVWRTGILLQEALRDYVVGRIRTCTIGTLTEAQLRQAAFDSHPRAYDRGGLGMVLLVAPELIPIIATIPAAEFLPTSDNFFPTWRQVVVTLGAISDDVVGNALAGLAGPAHTGVFRIARGRDQRRLTQMMALSRELGNMKAAINRGDLDHIAWLDQIIASLNAREFPDQGFARLAGEVVTAAQARRRHLIQQYNGLLNQSSEVRSRVNRAFPGLIQ